MSSDPCLCMRPGHARCGTWEFNSQRSVDSCAPLHVPSARPVRGSHSHSELSMPPVASIAASGDHATHSTQLLCPCQHATAPSALPRPQIQKHGHVWQPRHAQHPAAVPLPGRHGAVCASKTVQPKLWPYPATTLCTAPTRCALPGRHGAVSAPALQMCCHQHSPPKPSLLLEHDHWHSSGHPWS